MSKILYVEDNQDTAEAVQIILSANGLETDIASSGKQALKMIKEGYDLYLLDIMLPDMSGWDIFQSLQKEKVKGKAMFLSAIPVSSERMDELKKAGVVDYVTKPFDNEDLINRVKKALKTK